MRKPTRRSHLSLKYHALETICGHFGGSDFKIGQREELEEILQMAVKLMTYDPNYDEEDDDDEVPADEMETCQIRTPDREMKDEDDEDGDEDAYDEDYYSDEIEDDDSGKFAELLRELRV